jgi:probable HAF family extracellular repeat protein
MRIPNRPIRLLLPALALSTAASAQSLTLLDAGGLYASAASADGRVVAGYSLASYWVWTAETGRVDIGGVAPGNGVGGQAGISDDGRFVCGSSLNPKTGRAEAGRFDRESASWQRLGGIGSFSGGETSGGWGISGDGSTVVGLGWISAGSANAFRWRDSTGMVSLGTSVAGRSTRANGCNPDGSVVVGWQDAQNGFRQGAVWNGTVQTLITWTNGSQLGEAAACSADGTFVVGNGVSGNAWQPWRWSAAGGAISLGPPPTAGWRGAAVDISADGTRVAAFYRPFPAPATFGQGFLWIEGEGFLNLNAYAAAQGVTVPADVTLALPLGISADGYTIVGTARQGTASVPFILDLPRPEPACPADLDGNGEVNAADLSILLGGWGTATGDIDGDGSTDAADLTALLGAWGPCP